jgi:hypothetical protein
LSVLCAIPKWPLLSYREVAEPRLLSPGRQLPWLPRLLLSRLTLTTLPDAGAQAAEPDTVTLATVPTAESDMTSLVDVQIAEWNHTDPPALAPAALVLHTAQLVSVEAALQDTASRAGAPAAANKEAVQ